MSTAAEAKEKPQGNLELLTEWIGRTVSVMSVAADRYGVAGVLLHVDSWGIRLQQPQVSHPTFVPWVSVIQLDAG